MVALFCVSHAIILALLPDRVKQKLNIENGCKTLSEKSL